MGMEAGMSPSRAPWKDAGGREARRRDFLEVETSLLPLGKWVTH